MASTYSPTYVAILDLLFKTKGTKMPTFQIVQQNGRFNRVMTGLDSDRLDQDFYVAASDLWSICTQAEWHLVGRISTELKSYNALWYCDPKLKNNGNAKKSIKGLVDKSIIFKTETPHIYLINPIYIRRGEFFTVLNTTAGALQDCKKVTTDLVVDYQPLRGACYSREQLLLAHQNQLL
jgi:hypothetical protein